MSLSVDPPSRIVILGAGPIGLEACLYGRYLGYQVEVLEKGRILQAVRQWGHVRMFSPFKLNRSELGLAALVAQDPEYTPPADDAYLTGEEWIAQYLEPLAHSDLIEGQVREHSRVLAVSREESLKTERPGDIERGSEDFRVVYRNAEGGMEETRAEVVIDASGVTSQPAYLGSGGGPALGELDCREQLTYGIPDVLGSDREQFQGKEILVVGAGYSAATNLVLLRELIESDDRTRVTWVVRKPCAEAGPLARLDQDRLPGRDRLAAEANLIATSDDRFTFWEDTRVARLRHDDRFEVEFAGRHEGSATFDRILANVGYRPDNEIYRELQVHECYASQGPMRLAAALLGSTSQDCLDQQSHGAQALCSPEPNFYLLGSKSYGRNSQFLFSLGLDQIRDLFTLIGGRDGLDLYATAGSNEGRGA